MVLARAQKLDHSDDTMGVTSYLRSPATSQRAMVPVGVVATELRNASNARLGLVSCQLRMEIGFIHHPDAKTPEWVLLLRSFGPHQLI